MKARLGDYIIQVRGVTYKPEDVYKSSKMDSIPILRANNIQDDGLNFKDLVFVKKARVSDEQIIRAGDIVLCSSSGSKNLVGKAAIAKKDLHMSFGAFCKVVRTNKISAEYLGYFFQSPAYRRRIAEVAGGANINNIRNEHVDELIFPLIDKERQTVIIARLDKVTSLIALRKQQLSKLDELVKSQFIEMFGEPVTNPKKWPEKHLGELGELNRGISKNRPRNAPELLDGPYPLIQTGEVSNTGLYITNYTSTYSEAGLAQSKMWPKGTLCITIAANIAQTAILAIDACFPDSVVGFISNEQVENIYAHYWFGFFQKILEEQATQVAQKNINLKILNNLDVMVPPKELQNQFVLLVQQVDKSKFEIQKSLEKYETLKKALMQQYFG